MGVKVARNILVSFKEAYTRREKASSVCETAFQRSIHGPSTEETDELDESERAFVEAAEALAADLVKT